MAAPRAAAAVPSTLFQVTNPPKAIPLVHAVVVRSTPPTIVRMRQSSPTPQHSKVVQKIVQVLRDVQLPYLLFGVLTSIANPITSTEVENYVRTIAQNFCNFLLS